jgi:hypothetical protein
MKLLNLIIMIVFLRQHPAAAAPQHAAMEKSIVAERVKLHAPLILIIVKPAIILAIRLLLHATADNSAKMVAANAQPHAIINGMIQIILLGNQSAVHKKKFAIV